MHGKCNIIVLPHRNAHAQVPKGKRGIILNIFKLHEDQGNQIGIIQFKDASLVFYRKIPLSLEP